MVNDQIVMFCWRDEQVVLKELYFVNFASNEFQKRYFYIRVWKEYYVYISLGKKNLVAVSRYTLGQLLSASICV